MNATETNGECCGDTGGQHSKNTPSRTAEAPSPAENGSAKRRRAGKAGPDPRCRISFLAAPKGLVYQFKSISKFQARTDALLLERDGGQIRPGNALHLRACCLALRNAARAELWLNGSPDLSQADRLALLDRIDRLSQVATREYRRLGFEDGKPDPWSALHSAGPAVAQTPSADDSDTEPGETRETHANAQETATGSEGGADQ